VEKMGLFGAFIDNFGLIGVFKRSISEDEYEFWALKKNWALIVVSSIRNFKGFLVCGEINSWRNGDLVGTSYNFGLVKRQFVMVSFFEKI
jgi:hypothetical protein